MMSTIWVLWRASAFAMWCAQKNRGKFAIIGYFKLKEIRLMLFSFLLVKPHPHCAQSGIGIPQPRGQLPFTYSILSDRLNHFLGGLFTLISITLTHNSCYTINSQSTTEKINKKGASPRPYEGFEILLYDRHKGDWIFWTHKYAQKWSATQHGILDLMRCLNIVKFMQPEFKTEILLTFKSLLAYSKVSIA